MKNMRPVLIPHPAPRAPVGGADVTRSTRIAASYLRKDENSVGSSARSTY
jgi:hypothetical protein